MADWLIARGVDEGRILVEEQADNTEEMSLMPRRCWSGTVWMPAMPLRWSARIITCTVRTGIGERTWCP